MAHKPSRKLIKFQNESGIKKQLALEMMKNGKSK